MCSTPSAWPDASWGAATWWLWWRRAAADFDRAKAETTAASKLAKGQFDLDDLADQLAQMEKMGGMEGLMGLLPGVQKMKKQIAEAGVSDRVIRRQRAIIGSMTKKERRKPGILQRLRASAASPPGPGSRWPRSTGS